MTDVNLGTIFASVDLKTGPLSQAVQQVTSAVKVVKAELGSLDKIEAVPKLTSNLQKVKAEVTAIGQTHVGRKLGADLMTAMPALMNVSAAITALGLGAIKMSADFETSLNKVRNNTTMSAADFDKMKASVIALGNESGASLDQLGEGFMHITNFGIPAADAVTVLHEAMKSAVATGANVAGVADILAKALHEFGLNASDAGKAMNVMHLAAAEGNMTLEQFDQTAGPAMAVAANLGVTITDVSAAMSALTRHGLDAAEASTQVKDILQHIIGPSHQAQQELERLSKTSGINLVADFSQAGLKAKGLAGVLDDVARATHGNGEEIYKLVEAQRGGIGAMILAGNGAKDYKDILGSLSDAMSGRVDPTTEGYNRTLKTFNQQVEKVTNEIKTEFLPVGAKLVSVFQDGLPVLRTVASVLKGILDLFTGLPKPIQETIVAIGVLKSGTMALSVMMGNLGIETTAVTEKLGLLKAAEGEAAAEGALAFGPAGILMAALAGLAIELGNLKDKFDEMKQAEDDATASAKAYADQLGRMKAAGGSQGATAVAADLSREIDQLQTALSETNAEAKKAGVGNMTPSSASAWEASTLRDKLLDQGFDPKKSPFINSVLGVQARIDFDKADLKSIKLLQHEQVTEGAGAAKRAADRAGVGDFAHSVISHAFDQISTPQNIASCALFVSEVFKRAGAQVPAGGISSAKGLMDWAVKQGAAAHSAKDAFPGDLIVWHGDRYGAHQKGGGRSGYHVGLYLGDNKVRQSSNGVVQTMSMYDASHAQAYTIGTHATGAAAPSGGPAADQSDIDDLQARYVEATKGKYARKRFEALETYKADKATNAKEAWTVYQATLKKIHEEELADLKKHNAKLEAEQKAHLKRLAADQTVIDTARRLAATAKETREQIADHMAALADPEGRSFANQKTEARKKYRERMKALGGGTLGPYSTTQKTDFDAAQAELDATLAEIGSRETAYKQTKEDRKQKKFYTDNKQGNRDSYLTYLNAQLAAETDKGSERAQDLSAEIAGVMAPVKSLASSITSAQRDLWQKAGADMHAYFQSERDEVDLQAEAFRKDGAAQKEIDKWKQLRNDAITADEAVAGESKALSDLNEKFDEGKMSAAEYDAALKQLLGTIDDPQLKKQVQGEERRAGKEARDANPFNYLSEGAKESVGRSMEHFTTLKSFMRSWADDMKDIFKKLMVDFAMASIFGSKYGGGFNFGASGGSGQGGGGNPIAALLSMGKKAKQQAGGGVGTGAGGGTDAQAALDGPTGLDSFVYKGDEGGGTSVGMPGPQGSMMGAPTYIPQLQALMAAKGGAGGGAMGTASSALSIASMFSKGGMFAKLFAKGGLQAVFGHGLAAAMPWIGGALLLNSILKNPLKKIFHFSGGGKVPGTGFSDSVPAMLTPGERVLTRDQAKHGTGGAPPITINHYGDVHGVDHSAQVADTIGWQIYQRLPVATTG